MNILFVTPYYAPTSFGGIESQVRTISQSLSQPHNCYIIAPSKEKETISMEKKVKVYRTRTVNPAFREEADAARDYNFFNGIIKKEKIDKIIANNFYTWVNPITTAVLLSAARKNKIPVYLRVHNYCTKEGAGMLKSPYWEKYLCVSKSVATQIISLGAGKDKIAVIYPPKNTNNFFPKKDNFLRKKFSIPEDSILIMQASRIAGDKNAFDEKGIFPLLNIFSKLKDKNSHLLFCAAKTVAETTEEFNLAVLKIKEIAKELSISGRVHILSVEPEDMPKAYNNADIFIMLSKIETFGSVYAEAMACGLPVIGTNVGGIPEAIKDNKTGFIVNSGEETLVKLNLLIKNSSLRNSMGKAGIAHVKRNFDAQKIHKEIIEILSEK